MRDPFTPRVVAALAGILCLGLGSGVASGQTLTLTPSLNTSESYNDNVRLTPTKRQDDFVTLVTPGVRLELKDSPWSLTLDGSLQAQYYARQTDLNTTTGNRSADALLGYHSTAGFDLSLTDSYIRTLNTGNVGGQPGVFTPAPPGSATGSPPVTGVITGRFASWSNTVTPAASVQLTSRTSATTHYSFSLIRSEAPSTQDSDTHEAGLSLQHQLTPRTAGTVSYTFDRFQIQGSPDRDAHSPRVGFIFTYSPTIRFSTDTGLLFLEQANGSEEVTVATSTRYDQTFSQGNFSLGYTRNASVAGVLGVPSVSQSLTAALSYQPLRDLSLGLDAAVTDTESSGASRTRAEFLVSSVALRASYRLLRWLSLDARYQYLRQDDQRGPLTLDQNVFFLGLTASDQFRMY